MKVCPVCHNTFDDSQNFCLKDGTPLAPAAPEIEQPTFINRRDAPAAVPIPQQTTAPFDQSGFQQPVPAQPQPAAGTQRRNTGLIVALTALVTLFLVGVGAGGYWLLTRNREVVQSNPNTNSATPAKNSNLAVNTNANANRAANANLATPSPSPALSTTEIADIKNEVQDSLDGWAESTQDGDLGSHINYYADTVDYYKGGMVSRSRVRDDRAKAFQIYNYKLDVTLSNIRITPDASGSKATVVLDKEWDFDGEEKYSNGKVQQQLTFEKIGKQWRITGEKDLRLYHKDSN